MNWSTLPLWSRLSKFDKVPSKIYWVISPESGRVLVDELFVSRTICRSLDGLVSHML
jgi:hypothetical protein